MTTEDAAASSTHSAQWVPTPMMPMLATSALPVLFCFVLFYFLFFEYWFFLKEIFLPSVTAAIKSLLSTMTMMPCQYMAGAFFVSFFFSLLLAQHHHYPPLTQRVPGKKEWCCIFFCFFLFFFLFFFWICFFFFFWWLTFSFSFWKIILFTSIYLMTASQPPWWQPSPSIKYIKYIYIYLKFYNYKSVNQSLVTSVTISFINFTCYYTTTTIDNWNAQHLIDNPYNSQWPPMWLTYLQTQKG